MSINEHIIFTTSASEISSYMALKVTQFGKVLSGIFNAEVSNYSVLFQTELVRNTYEDLERIDCDL